MGEANEGIVMRAGKLIFWGCCLVMVAGAAAGIWKRESLTAWYRTTKLEGASPEMLNTLTNQFESMGTVGTEALVSVFKSDKESACQNASTVLMKMLSVWGADDPRRAVVFTQLTEGCSQFSVPGQKCSVGLMQQLFSEATPSPQVNEVMVKLLSQVSNQAETRLAVYQMLAQLTQTEQGLTEGLQKQARTWVLAGIQDKSEQVRLAAIRLAVVPGLQLHEHLLPLVNGTTTDPCAEVRQLTILALGEHEQLLSTDQLCKFLHDGCEEVRSITERALKIRGLSGTQLTLARRMNDPNPAARAEVPALVLSSPEIDAYLWMERLTRDPSPSVRAASARAMGQLKDERMIALLKQLAEKDQDASVQQIARFYEK